MSNETHEPYFELTVKVRIREDHRLVADPAVYENGSPAQTLLKETLASGLTFGTENGAVEYSDPKLMWNAKRILHSREILDLVEQLNSDGPVRLPDDADEENTLLRLENYHPGVHVAERTELDGILIHA